jgi:hypothetical protein
VRSSTGNPRQQGACSQGGRGRRSSGVGDLPDLGHHEEREEHVVDAHRVVDEPRVTAPVRMDRNAAASTLQQPPGQQELGGTIPADRGPGGNVSACGGVERKAAQRQQGLVERRRPCLWPLVAVPSAVGPLPGHQPGDQLAVFDRTLNRAKP